MSWWGVKHAPDLIREMITAEELEHGTPACPIGSPEWCAKTEAALARALALLERVRPGLKQQSNQFALNARESGVDGLDNQYAALLADIDAFLKEVA